MQLDFTTREGRHEQGKFIQRAAEEAGLSLEALAREIGCSRALIYQYVSGATLAQPDRIQAIAERTGKPLLFFYGGEAAPEHLQDRLAGLQALLQAQVGPPDLQGAASSCEQLIALARQAGEPRLEATARLRLVTILLQQGENDRALTVLAQTLPHLRQHGFTSLLRTAEQNRGHALLALGRVEEAERCFTELAQSDEWQVRWQALVSLAAVAEQRGQYRQALELLDQALGLAGTAPSARAAQALRLYVGGNIANVHLDCGDPVQAAEEATTCLALAEQLANRDQYIEGLLTLGVCQRLRGTLTVSLQTLTTAVRWARMAEDKGREALGLAELAHTLVEAGRYEEARMRAKDALQQSIATGTRRAELAAQLALAAGYLRAGLPQDGRYHAAQAWEASAHMGQPYTQAVALVTQAEAFAACGETDEARQAYRHGLDLAEAIGARIPAVQAAVGLARVHGEPVPPAAIEQARAVASPLLLWPVLLQCGIAAEGAEVLAEAEQHYADTIEVLGALRAPLADDAAGDTYLEYPLATEPYQRLAALCRLRGDAEQADAVIAAAAWPPLEAMAGGGV